MMIGKVGFCQGELMNKAGFSRQLTRKEWGMI